MQRSDEVAVVRNTPIVFACDDKVRSTLTASWYRQLGHEEVFAVAGGVGAWAAAGLDVETGAPSEPALGMDKAREGLEFYTAEDLATAMFDNVLTELAMELGAEDDEEIVIGDEQVALFVDTSGDFAAGHIPGARWAPRGWLELQIEHLVPSPETSIVVTCRDGRQSVLAAATLKGMGYSNVSVLEGGMTAWAAEELPVETGLSRSDEPAHGPGAQRPGPELCRYDELPAVGDGAGGEVRGRMITQRRQTKSRSKAVEEL